MLSPRPYQVDGLAHVTKLLQTQKAFVEASTTGYGKTVVMSLAAKAAGKRVAVICPKSVIRHWEKTLDMAGVETLFVLNPEKVKLGYAYPYGTWKIKKRRWQWLFPETLC